MMMLADFIQTHALVTGASSQIGRFLIPRLKMAGFTITAISRQPQPYQRGVTWQQLDLQVTTLPISPSQPYLLFHLAPLPLLPFGLARLAQPAAIKRIIAFSSTSCFSKRTSTDPQERAIVAQLTKAEQSLINWCQVKQVEWTLFRPTLIYGCGQDKNVSFIAQFIRRFGFFPLLGQGKGLRQPVHADDLAAACIQAALSLTAVNRAYNLSGGQTLSYRAMVEAIFQQLGKKPYIFSIPLPAFKLLVYSMAWLPTFAHLSTAMITRMNQDLCFDHSTAHHDFGYCPRKFSDNDMGILK
ncbi:MAG: NAD-dependent epimerase/dehydratase family protein [Thioploca sp.]|nr:NAD-dependent epimerase/dehydratase family protein [Thioploca sp.]